MYYRRYRKDSFRTYVAQMSSFENFAMLSTRTSSAALTTEFAMQTRQPQSSFALETARSRNLACA